MDVTDVRWRKASYSNSNGSCVEVGVKRTSAGETYLVRDTKDRSGPMLAFTTDEWNSFTAGVKDGEFDHKTF